MKITKQQFDELKNASDLEQVLKAVGIEVESEKYPQDGDVYSYVDDGGNIDESTWTDHPTDQFRQSLGNVHRTEADTEHYKATTLRRWQAEIAIRRWRDEHCPFTPDWTNFSQVKWYRYRYYRHDSHRWSAKDCWINQDSHVLYFATKADIEACGKALPDEWNALLID